MRSEVTFATENPMPGDHAVMKPVFVAATVAFVTLLTSSTADAQGIGRGMQRGADEGNRVGGPIGAVMGGVVGGAVGGAAGALGVDPGRRGYRTGLPSRRGYHRRHRHR